MQVETEFQKKKDLEILNRNRIPPPGLFWNPLYDPMTQNLYSNGDFDYTSSQGNGYNQNNSNENNKVLVQQQNLDYEKAVQLSKEIFEEKMNKEKEEKEEKDQKDLKKEENEKKENEEEKKKLEAKEKLERRKNELLQKLGAEPAETEEDFINILFRFPDGNKTTRRFLRKKTIEVILFIKRFP